MGTFDYLRCDAPLPDGWKPTLPDDFQTKDLDCVMGHAHITRDGRLLFRRDEYEDVPEDELEPKPENTDVWKTLAWINASRRFVRSTWHDLNWHGYVRFYAFERGENSVPGRPETLIWHDYRAKFTDGLLVEIVKLRDE